MSNVDPRALRADYEAFLNLLTEHYKQPDLIDRVGKKWVGDEYPTPELLTPDNIKHYSVPQLRDCCSMMLKKYPNFMLIFDNVAQMDHIRDYLPLTVGFRGQVIVTTQNPALFNINSKISGVSFPVEPMNAQEARQLLLNKFVDRTKLDALEQSGDFQSLMQESEGHPRSLLEAGNYLAGGMTFGKYLRSLESEPVPVSTSVSTAKSRSDEFSYRQFKYKIREVFYAGDAQANLLTHPTQPKERAALLLLQFCSVASPSAIPEHVLANWLKNQMKVNTTWTEEQWHTLTQEAIRLLEHHQLIEFHRPPIQRGQGEERGASNPMIQLHASVQQRFLRLVREQQEASRIALSPNELMIEALEFLSGLFKGDSRSVKRLCENAQLINHATHLLQQLEAQNIVIPPLKATHIFISLAHHYMQRDDYSAAAEWLAKGAASLEQYGNKTEKAYREAQFKLLRYQGRLSLFTHQQLDEAASHLELASQLGEALYGDQQIDYLVTQNDRAELLWLSSSEHYRPAETLLTKTISALGTIRQDIEQRGRNYQGDVPYEQHRAYRRRGQLYALQGHYGKAKRDLETARTYFEESNKRSEARDGSPIRLIDIYNVLGEFYLKMYQRSPNENDLKQAEDDFTRALVKCQQFQNEVQQMTSSHFQLYSGYRYQSQALEGLAQVAMAKGDYEKAEKLMEESLKLQQLIYSPNNPIRLKASEALQVIVIKKRQSEEGVSQHQLRR